MSKNTEYKIEKWVIPIENKNEDKFLFKISSYKTLNKLQIDFK